MLGMQQTSTILPPYTSNNYYTGSSPVLRCDLVADSRLCCGRLGKQVSQGCCDSGIVSACIEFVLFLYDQLNSILDITFSLCEPCKEQA